MYIVALITAGIALAYFSKSQDKQSYYKSILAIFGIAYFCVWRFVEFYAVIFSWDDLAKQTSFVVLVITALVLALTPWLRRITPIPAYSLVALFFIFVITTFTLEKNIKNTIAEMGGFFNADNPVNIAGSTTYKSRLFSYEAGGFTISVPDAWWQKKHPSGLIQFERLNDQEKLAELLPLCFHNTDVSIPEIIVNIKNSNKSQGIKTDYQCFRSRESRYTCFIRSKKLSANGNTEKWQWLVTDKWQNQNIELNFVFYNHSLQNRRESEYIIRSLQIVPIDPPLPPCIGSVDWF